ncbi:MAG: SDR family oxidoreductase [Actinobacteria bacterium]|nr:SDR family oxidoreductase [Actinomycetota bacterium]
MQVAALVTGAGGGIGRAAAAALSASGAKVLAVDLDPDAAKQAAEEDGLAAAAAAAASESGAPGEIVGFGADVADAAQVAAAVEEAVERFGRLDVLVNSAGVMHIDAAETFPATAWFRVQSINAGGIVNCCQAAYPHLRESPAPAIVNVASISQLRGQPGLLAYAASKGAVESMTRTLAIEWAPAGIRVNAVAPGHVRTPMVERALADGSLPQADLEGWERRIPLGNRLADPAEIADVIAFLTGPAARYVTGQVLVADGGLTINGTYD